MPEICDDILLLPVGNYSFSSFFCDRLLKNETALGPHIYQKGPPIGVGWVMQGWGVSCRGGVGYTVVGWAVKIFTE